MKRGQMLDIFTEMVIAVLQSKNQPKALGEFVYNRILPIKKELLGSKFIALFPLVTLVNFLSLLGCLIFATTLPKILAVGAIINLWLGLQVWRDYAKLAETYCIDSTFLLSVGCQQYVCSVEATEKVIKLIEKNGADGHPPEDLRAEYREEFIEIMRHFSVEYRKWVEKKTNEATNGTV